MRKYNRRASFRKPFFDITRMYGALGGNRTPDLMVRNHSLYPLSYKRAPMQFRV